MDSARHRCCVRCGRPTETFFEALTIVTLPRQKFFWFRHVEVEDATHALAQNSYDHAKECLQEGMVLITKRIKAIKLADKSDYGWLTV